MLPILSCGKQKDDTQSTATESSSIQLPTLRYNNKGDRQHR
jgi:hypothetical protein